MTADVTGMGVLRCLEAIKRNEPECRFYQAGSSEQFGEVREIPQTEDTPFHPRSPYGCAKVFAYEITRNYRESYGLYACTGILFNHESAAEHLASLGKNVHVLMDSGRELTPTLLWCVHIKTAVFDRKVAYAGGLDFVDSRLDWPEHLLQDLRRIPREDTRS